MKKSNINHSRINREKIKADLKTDDTSQINKEIEELIHKEIIKRQLHKLKAMPAEDITSEFVDQLYHLKQNHHKFAASRYDQYNTPNEFGSSNPSTKQILETLHNGFQRALYNEILPRFVSEKYNIDAKYILDIVHVLDRLIPGLSANKYRCCEDKQKAIQDNMNTALADVIKKITGITGLSSPSEDLISEIIHLVLQASARISNTYLIDQFLGDAIEVDVDALVDVEKNVFVFGIVQHVEEAGVHSGDSSCSLPPHSLPDDLMMDLENQTRKLAKELSVIGFINIQFAIQPKQNHKTYILEVNPRASRTIPFVAKATGQPIISWATKLILGLDTIPNLIPHYNKSFIERKPPLYAVKASFFHLINSLNTMQYYLLK